MRVTLAVVRVLISRCIGILLGMLCFMVIGLAPTAGQQGDLNAILRRQTQFMNAGDYAAALVEAEKAEALAKARFGVTHANYGVALYNLACTGRKVDTQTPRSFSSARWRSRRR
jgi:hypothetical protein